MFIFFCGKITEFHLLLNTKKNTRKYLKKLFKEIPSRQIFLCEMVFESHSVGYFALFFSSENREHATQICDRETFFFRSRRQQSKFIYFLFISEGVKNRFFMAH